MIKEKVGSIRERIKALNGAVFSAVTSFENETGLRVDSIKIERDLPFFAENPAVMLIDSLVNIREEYSYGGSTEKK